MNNISSRAVYLQKMFLLLHHNLCVVAIHTMKQIFGLVWVFLPWPSFVVQCVVQYFLPNSRWLVGIGYSHVKQSSDNGRSFSPSNEKFVINKYMFY